MSFNIKMSAPPGATLSPHEFQVLEPGRMKIRHPDNTETLMGYGVGDRIFVMQPTVQFLVCSYEVLDEVPLADGSSIIWYDDKIKLERMWGKRDPA